MRKKTLWQIREWGAWPHVYSAPLGRKLRSAARCDKLVKRLARNGRLFYVAPLVIHY